MPGCLKAKVGDIKCHRQSGDCKRTYFLFALFVVFFFFLTFFGQNQVVILLNSKVLTSFQFNNIIGACAIFTKASRGIPAGEIVIAQRLMGFEIGRKQGRQRKVQLSCMRAHILKCSMCLYMYAYNGTPFNAFLTHMWFTHGTGTCCRTLNLPH